MAEPTTTAIATLIAAGVTVPVLSIFGVPLGLRPDLLIAGFSGALVSIVLFNSIPESGDTLAELARTTWRRMCFAAASSLTAGYLAPIALAAISMPDSLLLGCAFAVGGGAQKVMRAAVAKVSGTADSSGAST